MSRSGCPPVVASCLLEPAVLSLFIDSEFHFGVQPLLCFQSFLALTAVECADITLFAPSSPAPRKMSITILNDPQLSSDVYDLLMSNTEACVVAYPFYRRTSTNTFAVCQRLPTSATYANRPFEDR
ncbi:unnamed protein product [Caenorhabditis auriculariae]|uniref:Uncharacterized protein n=1 Tax=Caenorhabditis auriculariae TaxID=2777116 RepID=A0A8S1GRL8_9PELO|nr:unnamed protein product [Caenorhabditis auriculariae]